MNLPPFRIERYYERYEFTTRYMLSSSDCESRSIAELLSLEPDAGARLLAHRLGYTKSAGDPGLRRAIADIYETIDPEEVVVATCAEEAIFLVYHALLSPGDRAVVETPCYEFGPGAGPEHRRGGGRAGTAPSRTGGRTTSTPSAGG